MQARSARMARELALGPHAARKRVFCEADEAPSTNGPTVDQPLVAAIRIFLLEERGEVLTPRSLPRTQSWRLDLQFCCFEEKISRFFFSALQGSDITNSNIQRVTNHSLETESLAFHPNSVGTSPHAHTPRYHQRTSSAFQSGTYSKLMKHLRRSLFTSE